MNVKGNECNGIITLEIRESQDLAKHFWGTARSRKKRKISSARIGTRDLLHIRAIYTRKNKTRLSLEKNLNKTQTIPYKRHIMTRLSKDASYPRTGVRVFPRV